jgi:VIT1/CCC1 family predicted Fe2+/Mn2+ transporter
MMAEELKLSEVSARPLRAALTTFLAFSLCGLMPLLPFVIKMDEFNAMFGLSALLAAMIFLALGIAKGRILQISVIASGLQTLVIGGAAAALAYSAGYLIHLAVYSAMG